MRPAPSSQDECCGPGYVDDAARSWLLHHASALAYPSLDEGFGFPLLDAMQAGVPIVVDRGRIDPRGRRRRSTAQRAATTWRSLAANITEAVTSSDTRVAPRHRRHRTAGALRVGGHRASDERPLPPARRRAPRVIAVVCGGVGAARFLRALRSVVDPADVVGDRQHGRRHDAARPVDLTGPRHDRLHARRRDRPDARLGSRRRDVARDGVAGALRRRAPRRRRPPRRRGSTSATATSPRTSTARAGCARARRSPR